VRHPNDPPLPSGHTLPERSGRPGIGRRALLGAVGGAALLGALPAPAAAGTTSGLPLLAPLPPGAPDRKLFAPHEQRYAPYVVMLAPMANDIEDTDPATYGWFTGGWWRTPNVPYNARVQEHVYTLSWFYAHPRPWNPYAGDAALLARLDAALQYYLRLQHDDGSWPEYSPRERSRAATGFGLGYLSKTLENLRAAGVLPARQTEIRAALRKAMTWFLDPANSTVWLDPLRYANQYIAGLAGAALSLELDPDPALRERLTERIAFTATYGQSPQGFFYEPRGADVGYNFEVMLPDMAEIHAVTGDPAMLSMAREFVPWLGYNLVREPDGSGWFTNVAASARTSVRALDDEIREPDRAHLGSLFVPGAPGLAAFFTSREDRAAARAAWAADPAPVAAPNRGNTSPRIIAHVPHGEEFPTRAEKDAAIAELPYLQQDDFTELRRDGGQDFLFVRRPGLYLGAISAGGPRIWSVPASPSCGIPRRAWSCTRSTEPPAAGRPSSSAAGSTPTATWCPSTTPGRRPPAPGTAETSHPTPRSASGTARPTPPSPRTSPSPGRRSAVSSRPCRRRPS
jgi:hypothetical protein